jgi:hypothetical protein
LNSVALLSVGEPLRNAMFAVVLPESVRHFSSPWPCSFPTSTLSNDT